MQFKRLLSQMFASDPTPTPDTSERAVTTASAYGTRSYYSDTNPDKIVATKGMPYLQQIPRKNGYTYGLEQQRKNRSTGPGWTVAPSDPDDANAVMMAEFCADALKRMTGRFADSQKFMLDGIFLGYSIAELVWDDWQSATYGSRVGLAALKSKDPATFDFHTDKFGNVEYLTQGKYSSNPEQLDPNKFVIATYEGKGGNPYGIGIYSRIYWSDWFITEGWKIWGSAVERYGQPIIIVEPGNADDKGVDDVINNVQRSTGIKIPPGMKISFLETRSQGQAGYERFITEHKTNIQIAILGQTLTSEQGSTGSQALGNVHKSVRDEIIKDDTRWMYDILNEQLIRRLVDFNWADVVDYPTLMPAPTNDMTIKEQVEVMQMVQSMGYDVTQNHVENVTSIQRAQPDDDILVKPVTQPQFSAESKTNPMGKVEKFAQSTSTEGRKIVNTLEEIEGEGSEQYGELWKGIRDDLIKQATPAFEAGKVAFEPSITRKPLTTVLNKTYLMSYLVGRLSGQAALDATREKFKQTLTVLPSDVILPPKEALEWYNTLSDPMSGKAVQVARGYALDRASAVAIDDIGHASTVVRNVLRESINAGWGFDQFQKGVVEGLQEYTAITPTRLDLIFRNVTMSALNEGRMDQFKEAEEPAAINPIVAYVYDAIMDDRTSDFCSSMNGRKYAVGDPIIKSAQPQNHHNCRSMWSPVVQTEQDKKKYTIDKAYPVKDGEVLTPAKGFGA